MAIEIKQLMIKSSISEDDDATCSEEKDAHDVPSTSLKDEILNACRRMIAETAIEKGLR